MKTRPLCSCQATNRYKFGGKETLEPVSLDMLDFGARFYDPRIARWNTQDPLAEQNPSVSLYAYCSNNPISRIDPDGMLDDWVERIDVKANKMRLVFDPDVTGPGDPDLQVGDRYIGASFENRENGQSVRYRSDGSILYSSETDAYNRIVDQSHSSGNEGFLAMTDQGYLVLPDYKNDATTVDPKEYGYKFVNGNIVDPFGKTYNTFGTVHTHLDDSGPSTYTLNGYGDLGFGSYQTPNMPVYVLQMGNNVVSFLVAYPNPSGQRTNFKYNKFFFNDKANIRSLLKGKFSLKEYTMQNQYQFNNF